MKGEVIGINNSIASNGGANEGVGFSIPINLARWIMNELIAHGRVTRGALGVDLHPEFREEDATALGMDRPRGARIAQVHVRVAGGGGRPARWRRRAAIRRRRHHRPESPDQHGFDDRGRADRRGRCLARPPRAQTDGDRGRTRSDVDQSGRPPRRSRAAIRSGLIRRPNRPGTGSSYVLGLELATLNPELARRIELPESWRGALVLSVDSQSPLARMVKPGDVISAIDNQAIQTAEQTVKILNDARRSRPARDRAGPNERGQDGTVHSPGALMNALFRALDRLSGGIALSAAESRMTPSAALLDGQASDELAASLLTAWHQQGMTADELEGTVRAVPRSDDAVGPRNRARTPAGHVRNRRRRCGHGQYLHGGGLRRRSLRHPGREARQPRSNQPRGQLGRAGRAGRRSIDPEPEVSRRCLVETSLAFLFAPRYHPGLARLAPVRRRLPFRTVFNLIGPLCNPASPAYQLIGVPADTEAEMVAAVLSRQPHVTRAMVVTGCDGLDEITLDGPTTVRLVEPGQVRQARWVPEDFGLSRQGAGLLVVRDAHESAARLIRILEGETGAARDYVIANAAAAVTAATGCTVGEGAARAAAAIDTGTALRVLARYRELAPASGR